MSDEYKEKNYLDLSNARIDAGLDIIDRAFEEMSKTHHLNFFEMLSVLSAMEAKLKNHETAQYFLDNITKFADKVNCEDKDGR